MGQFTDQIKQSTRGLSLGIVITLLTIACGLTWEAGSILAEIRTGMTSFKKDVASLRKEVDDLNDKVVGLTPEGFHRRDAAEMMNELGDLNPTLKPPDPYELPGYLQYGGPRN